MTKLANKHFINRFKRGRHLREIARISKHGNQMQKAINNSSKTITYGSTMHKAEGDIFKIDELSKARTRQLSGQDIIPGTGIKDFSSPDATHQIEQLSLQKRDAFIQGKMTNLNRDVDAMTALHATEGVTHSQVNTAIQQATIAKDNLSLVAKTSGLGEITPELFAGVNPKGVKALGIAEKLMGRRYVEFISKKLGLPMNQHLAALNVIKRQKVAQKALESPSWLAKKLQLRTNPTEIAARRKAAK
jgi:hypothetical protein